MNKDILGYCYYCKGVIQHWDRFKVTDKGLIHANDLKDCYVISQTFIDEWGDEINLDEE